MHTFTPFQALDAYKRRVATIASDLVAEYRRTQEGTDVTATEDVRPKRIAGEGAGTQTHRHTDTDTQTHRHTDTQTHRHIDT